MAADSVKENIARSLKESDTKDGGKSALARAAELTEHINTVMGEIMDAHLSQPGPPNADVVGVVKAEDRRVANE